MSDAPADSARRGRPTPEPPSMHGCPLTDSRGQAVLHPSREQYVGVVERCSTRATRCAST